MEIKGFSQCIAANKQQACGLAAAASCGMVAACEFFICKLVLLLLVAATLRLLVAATLRLLVAATLRLLVAAKLQLIVCCNLAACAFFVCKLVKFDIYATFTCITYYHFVISSPGRCAICCGLEQVTFTPCLVLVKPRKQWTHDRLGQTVTRLETVLCLMY